MMMSSKQSEAQESAGEAMKEKNLGGKSKENPRNISTWRWTGRGDGSFNHTIV